MKLKHLFKPWIQKEVSDCNITGIQNDSRQIKAGDLFLAYPGAASDGRLFIEKALLAGAQAIAYEPQNFPKEAQLPETIPCIPIPDLAIKLGSIAKNFYGHSGDSLTTTGITGTNGKTTIAYQLAQAHDLLGQKAAYIGTIGQGAVHALEPLDNTTPDALCLQKLLSKYKQQQVKQVCMEVSSHALAQHRVDEIEFNQAIFTNLTLDHLDYHHSMEEYAAAKALLFAGASLEWAIINKDDKYHKIMVSALKPEVKLLTYGMNSDSDVTVINWNMDINGTDIEMKSPWGAHHLHIKALGAFNIYNSLALFSSLLASGYEPQKVVQIMSQLKAAPGRLEVVAQSPYVLVDYAHTPDALKNVLITLNQLKKGKLWIVFGCGGDRDKTKRPIMGKIASEYADRIVLTSDNPRSENPQTIINEIVQGIQVPSNLMQLVHRQEAIAYALGEADKEDIILIAGKGHEACQQIGSVKHIFSDRDVVFELRHKLR